MTKILVTGGTGLLGGQIVPQLRAAGPDVRVLSRRSRPAADGVEYVTGDLVAGTGTAAAVAGVDTVLHLAGGPKGDDVATRNLVRAAAEAGVRHLVYIGVIGADRVPIKWFRTKRDAEQAVAESGMPFTVLRAAQFHELTLKAVSAMAKLPLVPNPVGLRFQPVDSREVAARLTELTLAAPAGRVPDLAGPAVYPMGDLLRSYLTAAGRHRALVPVRIPGKAGKAYRAGDNLTVEGADIGKLTWEAFLAEKVG